MFINNLVGYILIFALVSVIVGLYVWKRKKINLKKAIKIFAYVLIGIFGIRYMWGRASIHTIHGLTFGTAGFTFTSATFLWFGLFCFLAIVFNCFYDYKFLKLLNKLIVLPLAFAGGILFFCTAKGLVGAEALATFNLRLTFFAIELGFILGLSIVFAIRDFFIWPNKKDALHLSIALIPMLLACMPVYYLQVVLGDLTAIEVIGFNLQHRIVLYIGIITPILIYTVLKNKDKNVKKCALIYIAFATLITYLDHKTYKQWLNPTSWPLHLCNTAMFLVPLCLLFDWRKLFYFTFFINVLGSFLAMFFPNYTNIGGWSDAGLYHFWVNHYIAFFMPILMVAFAIYKRPKWKEFRYSTIAFAIYFVAILLINVWFTNYKADVNFFFLNGDFIAEKFGKFGKNIFKGTWEFSIGNLKFVFHPLFQFAFFLVYVAGALGIWFIYEVGFQSADARADLYARRKVIKLDMIAFMQNVENRVITERKNEEEHKMLKIIDFSKKYGASKEFAVKNANLEVYAGEIFGFLGPNGAGKSTIIKSIVGIQPPTSGSIEICGFDNVRQDVPAKMRLGYVPDHYALYERLTGREYINYIADIYKVSKDDRNDWINSLVDKFELTAAFDNPMKTYSHGMKQKIAIIAALVHKPKVWVLDEPLTGLDPTSIHQVKETMKEYAKAGNIVFFSSHIIDVVERICDRIAIIKKGTIQKSITIKELDAKGIKLEDYYLETIGAKTVSEVKSIGVSSAVVKAEKIEENKKSESKIAKRPKTNPLPTKGKNK